MAGQYSDESSEAAYNPRPPFPRNLVFVDVEGHGPAPGPLHDAAAFEFGAAVLNNGVVDTFHGQGATKEMFEFFRNWLALVAPGRPVFVSDNPAYDWQFINYYFHLFLGENPFGHSARRISDFYAGLTRRWGNTQEWKRYRQTPHTHHPVNDALGNLEAFLTIFDKFNLARLPKGTSLTTVDEAEQAARKFHVGDPKYPEAPQWPFNQHEVLCVNSTTKVEEWR